MINGELQIKKVNLSYDELYTFEEIKDKFLIRLNKKWGIIDNTGSFIINPIYQNPVYYEEKIIPVKWDGRWG